MLPITINDSLATPRTATSSSRKARSIRIFIVVVSIVFFGITIFQFHFLRKRMLPNNKHRQQPVEGRLASEQHLASTGNETQIEQQQIQNLILNEQFQKDIHVFYYIWWQNKQTADGTFYLHWNHEVLPHWTAMENKKYPQIGQKHNPEKDHIASNFWPLRGPYSSDDVSIVRSHFESMAKHGIGTVVISWWGRKEIAGPGTDEGGLSSDKQFDELVPMLLEEAQRVGLKICFHLEPYKGRTAESTVKDVKYLIDSYGSSPALLKIRLDSYGISSNLGRASVDKELPLFYIYDSYLTSSQEWKQVLGKDGAKTIRGTKYDAIMLGLYLKQHESERQLVDAGFDGFYTYFAAQQFTEGSTSSNWDRISQFAKTNSLLFVPSVGPGYIDENIRPWNSQNTKQRENGRYYDTMFSKAVEVKAPIISITSYNEWHEGTQIEESVPKTAADGRKYHDFAPEQPDFYMQKTLDWAQKFFDSKVKK